MNTKGRLNYFDVARGLAIILMVLGHCDGIGYVSKFVNLFHMAVFVFISGYFFKSDFTNFKDMVDYLKVRISKLYLFYLKYELLFFLLTNLFFKIGFYNSLINYGNKIVMPIKSPMMLINGIIKIVFLMGREPFCGAFWFIVSLMFIIVFYSLIVFTANKQKIIDSQKFKLLIVICFFLLGCIMNKYNLNIPRISPSFTLLLVYYFGNICEEKKINIKFNNIYMFILAFISIFYCYNLGYVYINQNKFSSGLFLLIIFYCGIYVIMFIAKKLNKARCLQYIGKNTLPVIAWHYFGFKIIMLIQLLFGKIKFNDLARLTSINKKYDYWFLLCLIVGIIFPLVLDLFVKKMLYRKKNLI